VLDRASRLLQNLEKPDSDFRWNRVRVQELIAFLEAKDAIFIASNRFFPAGRGWTAPFLPAASAQIPYQCCQISDAQVAFLRDLEHIRPVVRVQQRRDCDVAGGEKSGSADTRLTAINAMGGQEPVQLALAERATRMRRESSDRPRAPGGGLFELSTIARKKVFGDDLDDLFDPLPTCPVFDR